MNILALIPARMGSSRFPGKPMAIIKGKPMIQHVYENICDSNILTATVVATCDVEINDYITSIGGISIMTSEEHERASDRCAEALLKYEIQSGTIVDIVVMVQGDEPMITSSMIEAAISPMLKDENINVVNLLGEIRSAAEFEDRNCIKVVCDLELNALYFSREPIPSRALRTTIPVGKQVCVIPFKRDYLLQYTKMSPTPLEGAESIDMLRILEHGGKIHMVRTDVQTQSVDNMEDLMKVEGLLR